MRNKLLLLVGVMALGTAADTVAWWRFGDFGTNGGTAAITDRFTNSVNSSLYLAIPVTFTNQTSSVWSGSRYSEWNSTYAPSLVNPFANYSSLKVYDPVSGETHVTAGALHCPWGGNESGFSGGAVVNVDPALYGRDAEGNQTNFTFECFFRTTEAGLARSQLMEPIAGIPRPDGDFGAWSLVIYSRHLWARCSLERDDGTTDYHQASMSQGPAITPDEWHHAAITYTVTNNTFRLYLDYKLVTSFTVDRASHSTGKIRASVDTSPKPHLMLGKGSYNTDRSLDGDIAEARISNEALAPEEFLRFKEEGVAGDRTSGDPALLAWFSLNSLDSGMGSFMTENTKIDTGISTAFTGMRVTPPDGNPATTISDTPGAFGKIGFFDGENMNVLDNPGSWLIRTNNCDNTYLKIADPDYSLTSDSFTLEFFMKTASPVISGTSLSNSYGVVGHAFFKMLVIKDDGRLFFRPYCDDGEHGASCGTVRIDDGDWHHVAIVYDKDDNYNISVYYDHGRIYTHSGSPLKTGKYNALNEFTVGCSRRIGSGDAVQAFDGQIDEVRLTRRALDVSEFLLSCAEETGNMLARIPFDGDTLLYPYGYMGTRSICVSGTSQLPTLIPDARARKLITGDDDSTIVADGGACRFEGGTLYYPHIQQLERSNVTIEFFWRPYGKFAPWPVVLGLSGAVGTTAAKADHDGHPNKASWYFLYKSVWDYAQLDMVVDYIKNGDGTTNAIEIAASPEYLSTNNAGQASTPGSALAAFDGKWHHVAATLEERVDANSVTTTVVTTYFDYKQKSQSTLNGRVFFNAGQTGLMTQMGYASGARLATWDIDEVRITGEVLPPSSFCRAFSGGLKLYFR